MIAPSCHPAGSRITSWRRGGTLGGLRALGSGVDGAALHAQVEGGDALSHWAALVLTGLGEGLPLLTLQPADRPWETWLVLPVAWALAVWAARQFTCPDPVSGATTTGGLATVTFRDRP